MKLAIALFAATLTATAAEPFDALQFLIGEWRGEGAGQPGASTGGFTFAPDLEGKILTRRSEASHPATKDRPAFTHRDLTIIYRTDAGPRATYFDSEGHQIAYKVEVLPARITFTSENRANEPSFRLEYTWTPPDTDRVRIIFAIRPPGAPEFKTYTEGTVRRVPTRTQPK